MTYIDGFLAPIPAANKAEYTQFARAVAQIFKEHGALGAVDCWGDDVPEGKVTSMHKAVQRKEGEVVLFGWVTWHF